VAGENRLTPELFHRGLLWPDYFASMTTNRQLLANKLADFRLPLKDAALWAEYPSALNVLVLTEDWCQDSITSLPPLVAVASIVPALTLRVFRREANLSLARALLRAEYPPIPAFIFYDAAFNELGRYVEKPTGWRAVQEDPEEMAWLRADPAMYDATWWELELDELRSIVAR
jgi:hypothetical protein